MGGKWEVQFRTLGMFENQSPALEVHVGASDGQTDGCAEAVHEHSISN